MEYRIFHLVRHKIRVPFFIRIIFATILFILSIPQILLPIFPGSLITGVFMFSISLLLCVPWKRVRYIIKFRKWIIYMFKNIRNKIIIKHKMRDFSSHIKKILKDNKK